jgi:hypothetical protein
VPRPIAAALFNGQALAALPQFFRQTERQHVALVLCFCRRGVNIHRQLGEANADFLRTVSCLPDGLRLSEYSAFKRNRSPVMPYSYPTTSPSFHRTSAAESPIRVARPVDVAQPVMVETSAYPWLLMATSIGITVVLSAAAIFGGLVVLD